MTTSEIITLPTTEQSDQFFQGLPVLAPRPRHAMVVSIDAVDDVVQGVDDDIAKVSKDAPAIIAFADGVSEKNREAVMLGVEFAEVVARSKASVEEQPIEFLKHYSAAMLQAGWLGTGGHEYGEYTTSDKSLTMDSIVIDLISSIAGPNAAAVIALMSSVLDKLQQNEPLMKLFESQSKRGLNTSFRVMPCIESGSGIPVTYLLSMHCVYRSDSGGALFWKWKFSELSIKRMAKGVEFNSATLERNRARIINYLEGEADDFFNGLK